MKIIFNPSFPYRFFHMLFATYITTAFVIAGIASYYLLKKRYIEHSKIMLTMSIFFVAIFICGALQMHGRVKGEAQEITRSGACIRDEDGTPPACQAACYIKRPSYAPLLVCTAVSLSVGLIGAGAVLQHG